MSWSECWCWCCKMSLESAAGTCSSFCCEIEPSRLQTAGSVLGRSKLSARQRRKEGEGRGGAGGCVLKRRKTKNRMRRRAAATCCNWQGRQAQKEGKEEGEVGKIEAQGYSCRLTTSSAAGRAQRSRKWQSVNQVRRRRHSGCRQ